MKSIQNHNQVIIGNTYSGKWLKVSKQCFDIIGFGIDNNLTIDQLINKLADDEDKKYMSKLANKLVELDVLKNINEKEQQKIKSIDFAITNRCNLKCIHCCVDAKFNIENDELSTNEIYKIIDKMIKYNPEMISISGGEPMIRKDFIDILKYIDKNYGGKINLMTNGTYINKNNVNVLTNILDQIDISLDGVDEESCSLIRGEGIFGKVMDSIKLLQENNFSNITLSMVMIDINEHLKEEFDKLNKKLGTKPIPRVFSPIGRGESNKQKLIKIEKTNKKNISDMIRRQVEAKKSNMTICSCGAGCKTLYINYEGNIYPCSLFAEEEFKLTNVKDINSFESYLEGDYIKSQGYKALQKMWPDEYEQCKDCSINLFCWNCLHYLDLMRKGKGQLQNCKELRKEVGKIIWGAK
jgi:radical SAM protein with 4Fe4S-binding SPASM domain